MKGDHEFTNYGKNPELDDETLRKIDLASATTLKVFRDLKAIARESGIANDDIAENISFIGNILVRLVSSTVFNIAQGDKNEAFLQLQQFQKMFKQAVEILIEDAEEENNGVSPTHIH